MPRLSAVLFLAFAALTADQTLAQAERARTLHDTYCVGRHDTRAYTRKERLAQNYPAVREQVDRWQTNIKLNWSEQDVDLVSNWLAEHYYNVPCPDSC